MEQKKIDRINELAKKSKLEGLSFDEKEEQKALRQEYVAEWKRSVEETLDNVYLVDENGEERKLKKKNTD